MNKPRYLRAIVDRMESPMNPFLLLLDFLLLSIPLYVHRANPLQGLGLVPRSLPEFLKNTFLTLSTLILASVFLVLVLEFLHLNDIEKVAQTISALPLPTLAYLLLVRPFSEEVFFRGFLTPRTGILFSSILFALAHYAYGSIGEMIGAFMLGLLLAYRFRKTNDLSSNYAAHTLYNLISLVAGSG